MEAPELARLTSELGGQISHAIYHMFVCHSLSGQTMLNTYEAHLSDSMMQLLGG